MSLLRFLSNLLLVAFLAVGCNHLVRGSDAVHKYYIHPDVQGRALDAKMSDYLKKHLQRRCESNILDRDGIEVSIHVPMILEGISAFPTSRAAVMTFGPRTSAP